ncbi:hypothetical protein L596_028070 [Steinernema carpocapsae]|uniref:non-specific serine/threonine protein kinase n=1 Tax=Steinernema carpocapsae TaxID=34508 RepID=A0A4U5LXC4_STECR|nr:hypothetical protein L596_028070 [Steinernema carpocapsae]
MEDASGKASGSSDLADAQNQPGTSQNPRTDNSDSSSSASPLVMRPLNEEDAVAEERNRKWDEEVSRQAKFCAHSEAVYNRLGLRRDHRDKCHQLPEEEREKQIADTSDNWYLEFHDYEEMAAITNDCYASRKPPRIRNNYLISDELGRGAFAVVKDCIHIHTLERRAIKVVRAKTAFHQPAYNCEEEIEIWKGLKHMNVVQFIESWKNTKKKKTYMVMEYCVTSLQDMIPENGNHFEEFQAHRYFVQLMDGIDYLHHVKIVHKDIKPGNLMLDRAGILKITDFGTAEIFCDQKCGVSWKQERTSSIKGTPMGTPMFQPPELAMKADQEPVDGPPVDMWACGITLLNLVTGQYPYEKEGDMNIYRLLSFIGELKGNWDYGENHRLIADNTKLNALLRGLLTVDASQRWDSRQVRTSEWFMTEFPVRQDALIPVRAFNNKVPSRPFAVDQIKDVCIIQEAQRVRRQPGGNDPRAFGDDGDYQAGFPGQGGQPGPSSADNVVRSGASGGQDRHRAATKRRASGDDESRGNQEANPLMSDHPAQNQQDGEDNQQNTFRFLKCCFS